MPIESPHSPNSSDRQSTQVPNSGNGLSRSVTATGSHTETAFVAQTDGPISQRIWSQIEQSTGNFFNTFEANMVTRVGAGYLMSAIGGLTIAHHQGVHERMDLLMVSMVSCIAGGGAISLFISCAVPALQNFARQRAEAANNRIELVPLGSPENVV